MELTLARHYTLVCVECGARHADDGWMLTCPRPHAPAFLRTDYVATCLRPCSESEGFYRYRRWLPIVRNLPGAGRTVVYQSKRLGRMLGLPNLWIAFSGYWPERDASLETATFKELEAYTVLGRLPDTSHILVVASAGNTAAAFAAVCSRNARPCLLVIPATGLARLRFREPLHPCVRLIVLDGGADYADAITFAESVAHLPGFHAEGGAWNVGRRDGLATVLFSAVEAIGRLPDRYVQAVGSGVGGIAIHEAASRLSAGQAETPRLPRLMLCQNAPFTPLYHAWQSRRRALVADDPEQSKRAIARTLAAELTNRRPPYVVPGGVYDVLTASGGDVLVAENMAVRGAMDTFLDVEGIDIEPAAGVALAVLRTAAVAGRIPRKDVVLLHITGGGRARLARDHALAQAEPYLRLTRQQLDCEHVLEQVADWAANAPSAPCSSGKLRTICRGVDGEGVRVLAAGCADGAGQAAGHQDRRPAKHHPEAPDS